MDEFDKFFGIGGGGGGSGTGNGGTNDGFRKVIKIGGGIRKPVTRNIEEPGPSGPQPKCNDTKESDLKRRYAEPYIKAQKETLIMEVDNDDGIDNISTSFTDTDIENIMLENSCSIYKQFPLRDRHDQKYVIDDRKHEIINAIEHNSVTIIEGPVGCGKSTRVPQWILREYQKKNKCCNIIVTQPRRISAVSLARRVSQENGYLPGSIIGYRIGQHKLVSPFTRLEYVTVGVLLKSIISENNLNLYTHVIIDEVHERNKDVDFMLILIRKLIQTTCRHVKVILMSATFDVNLFSEYFTTRTRVAIHKPFTIQLPEKHKFHVGQYYLEDLESFAETVPHIYFENASMHTDLLVTVSNLISHFDNLELEEANGCPPMQRYRPSVLIFLPGLHEIDCLFECLQENCMEKGWILIALHSSFSSEEQGRVFVPTPMGFRKIILSSNIAESSITIPDVKYVIDFCLSRVLVKTNRYESLQTVWASQHNCVQRAGRTGRVGPGRVYRLVPKDFYQSLKTEIEPEMKRCSLEHTILYLKTLNIGSPEEILALALSPPDLTKINATILNLKEIGAMLTTVNGKICHTDGDVSHLGKIIARLPLDVQVSKIIIFGYIMGCMEECIVIAVAICMDMVFNPSFRGVFNAYSAKLTWAQGTNSDCIAFLNAYHFLKTLSWGRNFQPKFDQRILLENELHFGLSEIREMFLKIKEITSELDHLGFQNMKPNFKTPWTNEKRKLLLKLVLAGGLYPNYFVVPGNKEESDREICKLFRGRDPKNTVYLSNMDRSHPGSIYNEEIKKLFFKCTEDEIIVDCDPHSNRVFITFPNAKRHQKDHQVNGKIAIPVYKAMKLDNRDMFIKIMTTEAATRYMSNLGMSYLYNAPFLAKAPHSIKNALLPRLPHLNETYIKVIVTNIINCELFYVQRVDDEAKRQLDYLNSIMNTGGLSMLQYQPRVDEVYAALLEDKNVYARLLIKKVYNDFVQGFFIDYGVTYNGPFEGMLRFDGSFNEVLRIRALAYECTLAEITPSIMCDESATWTKPAINLFYDTVAGRVLKAKVYSVYNGIVSLELLDENGENSVNEMLIKKGFAVKSDETYESKMNHDIRMRSHLLTESQKNSLSEKQHHYQASSETNYEPPNPEDCQLTAKLKGPYSPLQTELMGLVYTERHMAIKIHQASINSVLLHSDPTFRNESLLVAAQVYQTSRENSISLRNTTLLPNIPGLPAILALLFSPRAELKKNREGTHYNAVLCGIGHENGVAICADRDMLVTIDTDLTEDDMKDINAIRYSIDSLLNNIVQQDKYLVSDDFQLEIISQVHKRLHDLLSKHRGFREPGTVFEQWKWDSGYTEEDIISPENIFEKDGVFHYHRIPKLRTLDDWTLANIMEKMAAVKKFCKRFENTDNTTMVCPICDTQPLTSSNLRIHLYSLPHIQTMSSLKLPEIAD